MRSLLRWLRRIALLIVALAVVVVGAALITAHTGWGREQLRRRIESALGDAFPGGVRVAEVTGSALGTLRLRGVELCGADRKPMISAATVDVAIALWPLVLQIARIDRAIADDVRVIVRDQPPAPPGEARPAEPSAWEVELPALELHRVAVEIDRARIALGDLEITGEGSVDGRRVALDGVVRGRWSRGGGAPVAVTAAGRLVIDGGVRIQGAIATLGDATITASGVAIDVDRPAGSITIAAPAAAIAAQVPELAGVLAGLPPGAGDVVATIEIASDAAATGDAANPPAARATIAAAIGTARLWAALRGEPSRRTVRGLISAVGIDLGAATRGRVGGRGQLIAAIDADPDGARGFALAFGEPLLAGAPIRSVAALVAGSLDGATAIALGSGDGGLQLAALGHVRVPGRSVVVDRGFAAVRASAAVVPCGEATGCPRITGAIDARARFAGTLAPGVELAIGGTLDGSQLEIAPDPGAPDRISIAQLRAPIDVRIAPDLHGQLATTITGSAAATALRRDELSIDSARGAFALRIAGAAQLDSAHLDATGIHRAGRRLGDGRVELVRRGSAYGLAATVRPAVDGLVVATDAQIERTTAGYAAAIGATHIALPDGTAWTSQGGSLVIPIAADVPGAASAAGAATAADAAIRLAGLTLRRGDASIALAGSYARGDGALAAHVEADRVDAAAVASLIAAAPEASIARSSTTAVRGTGRAMIDVARRGGQWRADASLAVSGFAAADGAAPVDGTAQLALAGKRATLDARVAGPALGELAVAIDTAAPADPIDLAGWRALDRDAIRTASITARQVALPALAALIGRPGAAPAGSIDGAIDLAPAGSSDPSRRRLAVRGFALPFGALDGDLTIEPRDGELDARLAARLSDVAAAEATARIEIPRHPFDPATWQRRGRDLVRDAAARLEHVAFDPALLARLAGPRVASLGLRGRASARLAIGAAAGDAQLTVDLDDVIGGPLAAPVSQHLEVTAGPQGTHVTSALRAASGSPGGLGTVDGDVAMTLDRWIDDPAAVLATRFTAAWTLPTTPLAPVFALLGRGELASGTIEGSATLRGTVGAPLVPSARIVVRDAGTAPRLGGRPAPAIRELAVAATWRGSSGTLKIDAGEATGGELHALITGSPDRPALITGTARMTKLDVAPIAAFLPGALASAAGELDGDLALRSGGKLTGALHLAHGALPLAPEIGVLREASAELASDGGKLTASLNGRLGRGAISLAVEAPADDPSRAAIRMTLEQVAPIAARRPVITAALRAQLERVAGQLRADVTVERAAITLLERTGPRLLDTAAPADLRLPGAPPAAGPARAPSHPWLIVHVRPAELQLDARDLAEGVGVLAELRTGPLEVSIGDTIGLVGRIAIASDAVEIVSRRYIVDLTPRGPSGIEFDGTTDPLVDLRLSYPFPELTLNVDVFGRLSKLGRPSFSSDPGGYSQDQLFGFFLGAAPGGDPGSQTRDRTREAVAAAGLRVVSGKLGRQVAKVLPVKVDTLSCEPDPLATASTSGSCTIGTWLSQNLFVAYRQRLQPRADENSGDVQFQYRLGGKVLIQGTGGDRGYYGVDVLWRHRE